MGGRRQIRKAHEEHRSSDAGRRRPVPRHRPRPRGRGDLVARPGGAQIAPGAEGRRRQARRLQRGDQERRRRSIPPPARDRPRTGRRLSGPPRARLSRRLHSVAGAVAQIAGQPLGRPRPIRRAAPDLRARSRDRGVQVARILDDRGHLHDRGRTELHRAPDPSRRQAARALRSRHRGKGARRRRRDPAARRALPSPRSRAGRSVATRSRRLRPRPCNRRLRASSACRPAVRCRSPSGSTKGSISAARRSG